MGPYGVLLVMMLKDANGNMSCSICNDTGVQENTGAPCTCKKKVYYCHKCKQWYSNDVPNCTGCGVDLTDASDSKVVDINDWRMHDQS